MVFANITVLPAFFLPRRVTTSDDIFRLIEVRHAKRQAASESKAKRQIAALLWPLSSWGSLDTVKFGVTCGIKNTWGRPSDSLWSASLISPTINLQSLLKVVMKELKFTNKSDHIVKDAHTTTDLARERNREAADRTLMAWIRTSLTLIGFGFGISKVFHYIEIARPAEVINQIYSARIFGGAFIALGTLALIGAVFDHWRVLKAIKKSGYTYMPQWPLTEAVALVLLCIGLFALIELFLR